MDFYMDGVMEVTVFISFLYQLVAKVKTFPLTYETSTFDKFVEEIIIIFDLERSKK